MKMDEIFGSIIGTIIILMFGSMIFLGMFNIICQMINQMFHYDILEMIRGLI